MANEGIRLTKKSCKDWAQETESDLPGIRNKKAEDSELRTVLEVRKEEEKSRDILGRLLLLHGSN